MRFSSFRYIERILQLMCGAERGIFYYFFFFPRDYFLFCETFGKVLNSDLKYCEIKSIKFLETIHDVFAGFQIKYKRFLKDF